MPKGSFQNKKLRQDEIVSCLRSRSYWTTVDLCNQVGTSLRTLRRDLVELKEMGIPIDSDRGRGGGIRLVGRWGLGRLQMSSTEVISLLLALIVAEQLKSPILMENLSSIRNRIASAFPSEQQIKINELRARILDGSKASQNVSQTYTMPDETILPAISQGFIDLKKIKIKYESEDNVITHRLIEPQFMLLNWPIWYLVAWDNLREDVRVFRIDRVKHAVLQRDDFRLKSRKLLIGDELDPYFNRL